MTRHDPAAGIRETDRADQAVAQLDQVRALREDLHRTTGARWIAAALDHILNPEQPASGPAATQATRTTTSEETP